MTGGYMFRHPLRRDPLVIGWAFVMLFAGTVALSNNTEWSGDLEADRVAGFIKDFAEAFLWSFLVLLLLAWLRDRGWRTSRRSAMAPQSSKPADTSPDLPWTDRWLRDWREEDARQRNQQQPPERPDQPLTVTCRHGVLIDVDP